MANRTGGAQIVEGLAATGMRRRLSLGSAWPTYSRKTINPSQFQAGMRSRCWRSGGLWRGQWKKMSRRRMRRWTWGRCPPLKIRRLKRRRCHRQLCWQQLAFGWVVQVARRPSWASARGLGERRPLDRQSSHPRPRQMKSWLTDSRRRNRRRRKHAKEEMWPPWRW